MHNRFVRQLWELALRISPELAITEIGQTRAARRHAQIYHAAAYDFIGQWDDYRNRCYVNSEARRILEN